MGTASRRRRVLLIAGIGAIWLGAVGFGMKLLWGYANGPGAAASAPASWPAGSALARDPSRPILVMFAHPRCPCTRASVAELAKLTATIGARARTLVVFFEADDAGDDWTRTDLWQSAAAIPGVEVVADRGAHEAARFGVVTSGQTILYDAGGRLRFAGGLTSARGHQGDTLGKAVLTSIVNDGSDTSATTAVFGCPIRQEDAR